MAFDELLAGKVREALINQKDMSEKKMFQGLCFMVDDKMPAFGGLRRARCVCVRDKELMCRIDPKKVESELDKANCRQMVHNGKAMKGYIFVEESGYKNQKDFKRLIDLCLAFNKVAKSSKKKKSK
jgi:hypothetical protein